MIYSDKKVFRHELKYYINYNHYHYLKNRIMYGLRLDKNALINDNYHIRSLYFDDIYNSAYKDKELGIYRRKKYRIRIYNKRGQYKKKYEAIQEMYKIYLKDKDTVTLFYDNNDILLYFGDLGTHLCKSKKYFEAENIYKTCIDISPNDPKCHYNFLLTKHMSGQLDKVINISKKLIKKFPAYADTYRLLSHTYNE